MDVSVSGHHMDLGEALRSRIVDQLSDGVAKYFERGGAADVRIAPDGHGYRADCTVNLASGQTLVSHGHGGDAHAAFDDALTKIEKRVRRYKRRLKNHHASGARGAAADFGAAAPNLSASSDDLEPDEAEREGTELDGAADEPLIVAETQTALRTVTVAMAVLELDLSGRPVQLFRNAAHGGLSVVYRREDGNIGWIDPERPAADPRLDGG